ncbi:acetoacetyl-CoA reductase [Granulosicoccaceae sp. 1_MG-2023]|nr:acetoacetyl-CoA reductase [Granulosicoccaceae sp. 1_MG-2023]
MAQSNTLALVTGGIGGIGSAICRALSTDSCHVVACYYPAEESKAQQWLNEARAEGLNVSVYPADVADAGAAAAMIESIEAQYGGIDVLVNCAGITRDKTIRKMPVEDWDAVINTNLNSVFYVTKPVMSGMLERRYGRIINISSVNGQRGQFGQPNYSAAKAGLHGFTMAAAQEGARKDVTVNTVSPGYVATPMTGKMPPEVLDSIVSTVPMGRLGKPEEIAAAVAFLAAPETAYVTGANIPVNGGLFMSF